MNPRHRSAGGTGKWGRIAVAAATGTCIVALAFVSKRVLDEPIRPLYLAMPPLLMFAYELVAYRHAEGHFARPGLWVTAVLLMTVAIVLAQVL